MDEADAAAVTQLPPDQASPRQNSQANQQRDPKGEDRRRPCRYGHSCRKKDTCRFYHPSPASNNSRNSNNRPGNPCKFGSKCRSPHCQRDHPPGFSRNDVDMAGAGRGSGRGGRGRHGGRGGRSGRGASPKTRGVDSDQLDVGFYLGPLKPCEAEGYRAAGVLVTRRRSPEPVNCNRMFETISPPSEEQLNSSKSTGGVQVLLCAEIRKKNKTSKGRDIQLNFIGGKIEDHDQLDSRRTAAREFWEETGQILDRNLCNELAGVMGEDTTTSSSTILNSGSIWCGPGKYALYVAAIGGNDEAAAIWDELPHTYDKLAAAGALPTGSDPRYLVWVDWELLCKSKSFRFFVPRETTAVPKDELTLDPTKMELNLSLSGFAGPVCHNDEFQALVSDLLKGGGSNNAATTGQGDQLHDISAQVDSLHLGDGPVEK